MTQKISEIMTPDPTALRAEQPLTEAAQTMRTYGVGSLLVMDDGHLKGLVTDRDIVVRALASGRDPGTTPVSAVCSPDLITAAPDDDLDTAIQRMREHAVRRIPVVDKGRPVGILSLGDAAIERDERSVLAEISAQPPNT